MIVKLSLFAPLKWHLEKVSGTKQIDFQRSYFSKK
jgi:hypothetical protein